MDTLLICINIHLWEVSPFTYIHVVTSNKYFCKSFSICGDVNSTTDGIVWLDIFAGSKYKVLVKHVIVTSSDY